MYRSTAVIVLHTHPICPRHPGCESISALWEVIRRLIANQPHGSLTLAPSLWPDRELRKYHYPLYPSSPPPVAIRICRISFIARSILEVVAHLRAGSGYR